MTESQRDQLIVDHLPKTLALARAIYRKLPKTVDFEDLYQSGSVGLIKAADRFDGRAKFWTYAQQRVRGEILDYLRLQDHLSSSKRKQMKSEDSMAEAEMCPLSLTAEMEIGCLLDTIMDSRPLQDEGAEEQERSRLLRRAIDCLPDRKSKILRDYYWRGDIMSIIAERAGVDASRIRQLHNVSIAKLAAHFTAVGITSEKQL